MFSENTYQYSQPTNRPVTKLAPLKKITTKFQEKLPHHNNQSAFNNIVLCQSEYVRIDKIQHNQPHQGIIYYKDNSKRCADQFSQCTSSISQDTLSIFLSRLDKILSRLIREQYLSTFEILMNIPIKKFSEFDPSQYKENNQQFQLELSDDDNDDHNGYHRSLQSSNKTPKRINFGFNAQRIKSNIQYKQQILQDKQIRVQNCKKIVKIDCCWKVYTCVSNLIEQPLDFINIKQQPEYQKMKYISKLNPYEFGSQFRDQQHQMSIFIDITQDMKKFSDVPQNIDFIQSNINENVSQLSQGSIINKINQLKKSSPKIISEDPKYVKKIKESQIVCQPRPISYHQNADIRQPNRPISYHHSPLCKIQTKPQNYIYKKQHIIHNKHNQYGIIDHKKSSLITTQFTTKQSSKLTERVQKSPQCIRNNHEFLKNSPQNPYQYSNGQKQHFIRVQNNNRGQINVIKPQYFSPPHQLFKTHYQRSYIPDNSNHRMVNNCRQKQLIISPRSAPSSPMVARNLVCNLPSNNNVNSNFKRTNPQRIYSRNNSFRNNNDQSNHTLQYRPISNGKPQSLNLIKQNNFEQKVQKNWKQHAIIHQQYYDSDYHRQYDKNRNKINLVTQRDQIVNKKKQRKRF